MKIIIKKIIYIFLALITTTCLFSFITYIVVYKFYYHSNVTNNSLNKLNLDGVDKLMIVAHPDDESFFGGAALIKDDYLVVCVTNGRNKVRKKEFINAMKSTNDKYIILNYEDKINNKRSDWKHTKDSITDNLKTIINYKDWDEIVTHNPEGEYGHIHHKTVSKIVTDIVNNMTTSKKKSTVLMYFGKYYSKKSLAKTSDSLTPLESNIATEKQKLIDSYKSQSKVNSSIGHMNIYENWTKAK